MQIRHVRWNIEYTQSIKSSNYKVRFGGTFVRFAIYSVLNIVLFACVLCKFAW